MINSYSNEYKILSKEVELPPNSSKYISFESIIAHIQKEIEINVVDKRDNIIQSKKINVQAWSPEHIWAGAISDTYEKLSYFNPKYFNIEGTFLSINDQFFNQENNLFIPTGETLSNFNVIIISNYNTDLLSEEWKNSIKKWVRDGKILVLDVGNNKEKITNAFPEMLSDEYSQAFDETSLNYLKTYIDENIFTGVQQQVYDNINIRKFENGAVVMCDFNLLQNSTDSYGFNNILQTIYTDNTYILGSEVNEMNDFKSNLISYTERMPNFNDNAISIIFFIIFLYAVFIGPVLYIILKKKDKRDSALKIIPIISISITIIIYAMSFRSNYKRPIANVISYSNLDLLFDNTYNSSIATNIVAPYKGNLTIEFDNELNLKGNLRKRYDYTYESQEDNGEKEKLYTQKFTFGDSLLFTRFDALKWDRNYSYMSKDIVFEGNIDFDIHVNKDFMLEGTIKNNTGYNFEDVVLGINKSYAKVDKFNNGDEIKLGKNENEIFIYNFDNKQYLPSILTDGMRDKYTIKLNVDIDREYALEMRQDMVSHIFSNVNDSNAIIRLVAFNSNQIINDEIKVNGRIPSITTTNVFTASKEINATDFVNKEIPYGLLKSNLDDKNDTIYSQRSINLLVDDYSNINQIEVDETIKLFEGHFYIPSELKLTSFQISWNTFGAYNEIFNHSTNSWEPLYTQQYNKDIVSNYIHENYITIRTSNLSESIVETPQIKISFE